MIEARKSCGTQRWMPSPMSQAQADRYIIYHAAFGQMYGLLAFPTETCCT
jgi:hypothetical protein